MSNTKRNGTDQLENLEARLHELGAMAQALTEQVRLARGTREITPPPPAAPAELPLADRLAAVLRATPSSIEDLVAALHVPAGRIAKEMKALRAAGLGRKLWNAGTDVAPKWFLPPGPDATPEVFAAAVLALIRLQPHSTGELQQATGTMGSKRVWHALVKLNDAKGSRIVRYGDPRRPRWFWLPEGMDLSRFAPRSGR